MEDGQRPAAAAVISSCLSAPPHSVSHLRHSSRPLGGESISQTKARMKERGNRLPRGGSSSPHSLSVSGDVPHTDGITLSAALAVPVPVPPGDKLFRRERSAHVRAFVRIVGAGETGASSKAANGKPRGRASKRSKPRTSFERARSWACRVTETLVQVAIVLSCPNILTIM